MLVLCNTEIKRNMKKIFLGFYALLFISAIVNAQALQQDLALKYVVHQPTGVSNPPVVIFMHGYGSNEQDLFELKNFLPKNFMVVSVRAPYPAGNGGYQWFEIGALNNRSGSKQLAESRSLVTKFITQVTTKYKADAKQVYLIGFSQGAMMCFAAGLTNATKVRGIAPLSGKMYPSLKNELKMSPELKQMKIFIAHGTADDRISFADGKAASNNLVSIGLKPEFHEYTGMGHTITNDVVKDLVKWIQK